MKKITCIALFVLPLLASISYAAPGGAELNVDRPGSDYSNFDLPQANAWLCRNHCNRDARCKAWTYVKPNTIQGPNPRCWLKSTVPPARHNNCCVSGVKGVTVKPTTRPGGAEPNVDRPGSDYSNFDLPQANAWLCRNHCNRDARCKAWTYVKPNTIQGPNPRCWLKSTVPPARHNNCCVSGVKGVTVKPTTRPGGAEPNVDRPGSDYSNFDLPQANAWLCRNHCNRDARCKAWTYVKPNTIQGPNPRCWLKSTVPPARHNNCCVSGVK